MTDVCTNAETEWAMLFGETGLCYLVTDVGRE